MLRELQRALEIIYGVSAPQPVEDFLVGPAALEGLGVQVRSKEELLVLPGSEALEVGLFLSPEVLARLPELSCEGGTSLLGELLPSFACAAEGVSHFVYLTVQAMRERRVTLAELEAQAEVDKFATGVLHLWKHGERNRSAQLRERLYDRVGYREDLSAEERHRYGLANRLGRRYASFLESRFVLQGRLEGLLAELRLTWRLPGEDKFARLFAGG